MKLDFGEKEQLKAGSYEVFILSISEDSGDFGKFLNVEYTVRDDVEQDGQGCTVRERIYKKTEPTEQDGQLEGYSFKRISWLARAAQIKNKDYSGLPEIVGELVGKWLRIDVEKKNGFLKVGSYYKSELYKPEFVKKSITVSEEDAGDVPF